MISTPQPETIQSFVEASKSYPVMGDLNMHNDTQQSFAIVIRENGQTLGGAVASINLNWAYVGTLWIDDSLRGQGAGTRLMRAVESYVHSLGLNGIYLYTVDFQAPEFYRKIGYDVMGTLSNHPQGHVATYYSKTILATDMLTPDFDVENPANKVTSKMLSAGLDRDAKDVAPIISYERLFIMRNEDGAILGGLFGHEFWGWLEVHVCYAQSADALMQVLDKVESFCDEQKIGILLQTYDKAQSDFIRDRGYEQWSMLKNRPTGKDCTFWVRDACKT